MPETKMIKVEETWGGGRYVSPSVLARAQAGSPTAIGALSSMGYSVKGGKIVRVATGEPVKDVSKEIQEYKEEKEKEKEVKVAEVKAQSPREVSVYDIQSLSKPSDVAKTSSPAEQFQKAAEGKTWNPFSQEWISVPKTEPEKKTEPPKIYTTTAPDVKTYKVPETLKTFGTATAVVTGLPQDMKKQVEKEKEKEREREVFEKAAAAYPVEQVQGFKTSPNIYRIEDYKPFLIEKGVSEEELDKRISEARAKGMELWVNPSTMQTFERPRNRVELSSPFEAYVLASKYGIKDYDLVKIDEGLYDFTTKEKNLKGVKIPDYKVYSLDRDFSNFIASEFVKEKSLKELVKEKGIEGLAKKIVKDSEIYELKEGYSFVEVDGKIYLVAVPKSEEEARKLEDILDKKFNEYLKSQMTKYQIERMAERGTGIEKAIIYGTTIPTSPIWSAGTFLFKGKEGLKEFAKEKAYSFAISRSPFEAAMKGALETETGLFSVSFLGSSLLSTAGAYGRGVAAYSKAMSDFYGKYKWLSKGIDIASGVGKVGQKALMVGSVGYAGVSLAPSVYYSVKTGDWKPTVWSVKQLGVGAAGFVVGSRFPLKSSVEFAQRMEAFRAAHSPEAILKPLEDKYLLGTRIRFGEEIVGKKAKGMGVYELDIGHTYVTKTGRVITELPKMGVAPEQSLKVTIYPMSAREYFKNVIWNKDFGVPERYLELRSPSLIEGYKKSFLKPVKHERFEYTVGLASKEGKPFFSETVKTDVGFPKYGDALAVREKYYSLYQYKDIDKLLSEKILAARLRGEAFVEPISKSNLVMKVSVPFEKGEKYKVYVTDEYRALVSKYFSYLKEKYPEFVSKSFEKGEMVIPRKGLQDISSKTAFREVKYYFAEDEKASELIKPYRSDLPPRNVLKDLSEHYKSLPRKLVEEGFKAEKAVGTKTPAASKFEAIKRVPEEEVIYVRVTPRVVLQELKLPVVPVSSEKLGLGLALGVSSFLREISPEKLEMKTLSVQGLKVKPLAAKELVSLRVQPQPQPQPVPIDLLPVQAQRQEVVQEQKLETVPALGLKEKFVPREIYRFEGVPPLLPPIFIRGKPSQKEPKEREIKEVEIREPLVDLKKVASTAYPDFYSALVSQAVYGKATAPRFTPEQLEKLREKGYIRVPTKEYRGMEDPNKVLKKIIGGA